MNCGKRSCGQYGKVHDRTARLIMLVPFKRTRFAPNTDIIGINGKNVAMAMSLDRHRFPVTY